MDRRKWIKFVATLALSALVLAGFSMPLGPLPSLGSLLDPTSGVWTIPGESRHPSNEQVFVNGLSAPVTVLRDANGVPHIYAENGLDGWFAVGYVHAQDRLWQMDLQYRAAAGRLSEVLGPRFRDTDEFFRTIGLNRIAAQAATSREAADEFDLAVLRAYSAGVNASIASTPRAEWPLEYKLLDYVPEPWSPEKSIAEGLLIGFGLAVSFFDLEYNLLIETLNRTAASELFPIYPAALQYPIEPGSGARPGPVAVSASSLLSSRAAEDILRKAAIAAAAIPQFESAGSNNWAVAGNRTASGKPLLAADPHLGFQLPALWYWAELQAHPYHVRGATFPGIPGFFFGTNGVIAWGETNTGADVTDFYAETMSSDGRQFSYQGEWFPVSVREERIKVRGEPDDVFTVLGTRHGPIVTEFDQTVAMNSTIPEFRGELKAILLINQAHNWTEFRDALRDWRVPAQNFIYADVNGNIGIRSNGLLPLRNGTTPENARAREPLIGSTGLQEWTGWVPFDHYPEAYNPAQGFVTSTNQVPVGPAYPYYLGTTWDEGYRARRIHALLAADDHVTFDDLGRFQQDVHDAAAEAVVPYLLGASVTPRDERDYQALDILRTWAFDMTADAVAPTLWWTFLSAYREATFGDEYAAAGAADLSFPAINTLEALTSDDPASHWFDNVSTPSVRETRDDTLRTAFAATIDRLVAEMGPDVSSWTWGRRHFRQFDHLTGLDSLARGPYPSVGDGFTLNVADGLVARSGPSWRQLLDFSDLNASLAIYPGGQSANPLSLHYDDFLLAYVAADYLPFRSYPTRADLPPAFVESALTLLPR